MSRVPVPDFQLPRSEGISGWALVFSVVTNLALLSMLVWLGSRLTPGEEWLLSQEDRPDRVVEMVLLVGKDEQPEAPLPTAGVGDTVRAVAPEPVDTTETLAELPEVEEEAPVEVVVPPTETPVDVADMIVDQLADTVPRPVVIGTRRILGPAYGDGRVWAPIQLTDMERAVLAVGVAEIDSTLRERILAEIRRIPPDSFALNTGDRDWTAMIGDQKVGIDPQFVYLGPIKIPTFLLAFLPLDLPESNIFDQREKRRYEQIRQEIIRQAQRQADTKQVKAYIAEIRERVDEERRRRIETVADSLVATRDTIIPQ